MKKLIIASVAALGFASPALAQESDVSLSGFRLEAIAGIDRVNVDDGGARGVAYGLAGGYDFNRGSVLFGVDAEATLSTTDNCCAEAGRDLYVGGRVGTPIGSGAQLYVKAGYTNARVETYYGDYNLDGVRVGAGFELPLQSKLFVKAEYRYSNYELGFERHQVLAGLGTRF